MMAPIKDNEKLGRLKKHLENTTHPMGTLLYNLSVYTGLRLEDILLLKIGQADETHIRLREKGTNKAQRIAINPNLKAVLPAGEEDEYMIKDPNYNNPLEIEKVLNILKTAAAAVGIEGFNEDTLRQTFGYHLYKSFRSRDKEFPRIFFDKEKQIEMLQDILGLDSKDETKRYIGIANYPFMRKRFGVD